uniref:Protein-tyrosine-phosphatase n=1 Tax=Macrostomum lignano TaxID=282301 RepID=A0A1I8FGB6_9PLAT
MSSNWNLSCFLILSCCLISSNVQANIRCGVANPNQVDKITLAIVRRSTVSEIIVDWLQPSTVPELWDFYYVLSCPGCTGHEQQITTSGTTYKFSGLIPAMEYVVLLQAGHRDCELSPSYVLNAKTALSNLPEPLHFSDIDETSFRVHWVPSPDVGIRYEVSCAGIVDGDSVLCSNLQSGASIDVTVRTVKPGFPQSSYVRGTALTKLFPIDVNKVQYAVYETGITVSWSESNTPAVTYALTCSRVGTNSDVTVVKSTVPMATCKNLHTGLEYNLSVIVQKPGGFEDTVTYLGTRHIEETTRPNENEGSCPSVDWQLFKGFCYLLVKGSNGRNLTEAVSDCQRRDPSAHLLWVTSQAEMDWVTDYSERNWRLREDYRAQCRDCRNLGDAAWTGLYRDEADGGNFKWLIDNSNLDVTVNWFFLEPGNPPRNYGYIYGTVNNLYFRTYSPESKHYHFCKAPVFVSTTAPTGATATTAIATREPKTTHEIVTLPTISPNLTTLQSTPETTTVMLTTTTAPRRACPSQDWLQFKGFCYLLVKGSNGRNLTEAVSDCQRRDPSAHLLWVTSQSEMDWVMDTSARNWRLREDYRAQCRDCRFQGDAAWTGLYRDEADGGNFKWLIDNSNVDVTVQALSLLQSACVCQHNGATAYTNINEHSKNRINNIDYVRVYSTNWG